MTTDVLGEEPLTREEARRILRRLELDAYSAIVTAFRAQGDINKSKKKVLNELSNHLSISTERHRAEIRRVVNDERLNAVAECMRGPGTCTEWAIEGRRLVSLMPRLVPQTLFTAKASAAAGQAFEANNRLPLKAEIEVTPLPAKAKLNAAKSDAVLSDSAEGNSGEEEAGRMAKKKKLSTLFSKPAAVALKNPLSANAVRTALGATLKPVIQNSVDKSPLSGPASKVVAPGVASTVTYPSKPIILQRSPSKLPQNQSRSPSGQLQALGACLNSAHVSLSSAAVSSLTKSDASIQLIQSPMIKIVSSSVSSGSPVLPSASSSSSPMISALSSSSITQKIKFKSPLPKPKVKSGKFKPIVQIQRSGLFPATVSPDALNASVSVVVCSSQVPLAPLPPVKVVASNTTPNSVKVVQVSKTAIGASATVPLQDNHRPSVVASGCGGESTSLRVVASTTSPTGPYSPQVKIAAMPNMPQQAASAVASLQKSSPMSTKTIPYATGFKMIAVTTVVAGTSQVKTVYIATPIMSLTKSVSQTSNSSISTPAVQTTRQISTSLVSSLQSAAARSTQAHHRHQHVQQQRSVQTPMLALPDIASVTTDRFQISNQGAISLQGNSIVTSATTVQPIAIGHSAKLSAQTPDNVVVSVGAPSTNQAHTLTAFSSAARSSSSPSACSVYGLGSMTLLHNSLTPAHHVGIQNLTTLRLPGPDLQQVNRILEKPLVAQSLQDVTVQASAAEPVAVAHSPCLDLPVTAVTPSDGNLGDLASSVDLLDDEPFLGADQASDSVPSDDLSYLTAGEKFLEQLSAKLTSMSPMSQKVGESFVFPASTSLHVSPDVQRQKDTPSIFEQKDPCSTVEVPTGGSPAIDFEITCAEPVVSFADGRNLVDERVVIDSLQAVGALLPPKLPIANALINLSESNSDVTVSAGMSNGLRLVLSPSAFAGEKGSNHQRCSSLVNGMHSLSGACVDELVMNGVHEHSLLSTAVEINSCCASPTVDQVSVCSFTPAPGNLSASPVLVSSHTQDVPNSHVKPGPSSIPSVHTPGLVRSSPPSGTQISSPVSNEFPSLVNSHFNSNLKVLAPGHSSVVFDAPTVAPSSNASLEIEYGDEDYANNLEMAAYSANLEVNSAKRRLIGDVNNAVNPKKRKAGLTDWSPPRIQAGWVRGASNLLQRVSRFRGANKQKGEKNAASWFTKAVDPKEAPGYYEIVKVPMDFSKIKKRLEDGQYNSYSEFFDDMMLVKRNCYLYNPEGHIARQDCDAVFGFFEAEYEKLLERWQRARSNVNSHVYITSQAACLPDENMCPTSSPVKKMRLSAFEET